MTEAYRPQDLMWLWWLGDAVPRRVGSISLTAGHRKVALTYDAQWIEQGFALSEDLPLAGGLWVPKENDSAAGALEDARPDRWGERVIRHIRRPSRLSLLEFLYFAGDDRFGGLGVSLKPEAYAPCALGAIASLASLHDMQKAIAKIIAGEKLDESLTRLVRPGPTFGGARPKSLMQDGAQQWIVKFPEDEELDVGLIEHATMTLGARCGVAPAATMALPLSKWHAVAVARFDRPGGMRLHALTAYTALRAAGMEDGYPELAQLLRRIGHPDQFRQDQALLFRRMVFNMLVDNTDDNHKNHTLIRGPDGYHRLSPAYDVLPSAQGLGYQQMRVGREGAASTLSNALTEAGAFGLKPDQAVAVVTEVCRCVADWKPHFAQTGVSARDLDVLSQYLDGPALADQRREFAGR